MLRRLIRVLTISPNWEACLKSPSSTEGLRFLSAFLTLGLENGKTVTNQMSLGFSEPTSSFTSRQEPDWLSSEEKTASDVELGEELIFNDAWQIAEKAHQLAASRSTLQIEEAKSLMQEPSAIKAFSLFADSQTYSKGLKYPRILRLPKLADALLYADSIWAVEEGADIRAAIRQLETDYDFTTGELRRSSDHFKDRNSYIRKPIPEGIRREVWRRDSARCVQCGSQERLEFDHIVPLSKGGADTTRNLQLLCEPCNRKKSARI